jgi:hypothetical protein
MSSSEYVETGNYTTGTVLVNRRRLILEQCSGQIKIFSLQQEFA